MITNLIVGIVSQIVTTNIDYDKGLKNWDDYMGRYDHLGLNNKTEYYYVNTNTIVTFVHEGTTNVVILKIYPPHLYFKREIKREYVNKTNTYITVEKKVE